jgi:hypothetical protein
MLDEVYVPVLIALVGALFSAYVAHRTARNELESHSLSIQQRLLELVAADRLSCYRQLFRILSDLPKALEDRPTVQINLQECLQTVNLWDSTNSLILSRDCSNICYEFRTALVASAQGGESEAFRSSYGQGRTTGIGSQE